MVRRKRRNRGLLSYLAYWFVRGSVAVLQLLPERAIYALLAGVGNGYYFLAAERRRISLQNLRQAFGEEADPKLLRRHARRATANVFRVFADFLMMRRFAEPSRWRQRVDMSTIDPVVAQRRGAFVFVTLHLGSWEVGLGVTTRLGLTMNAIMRRIENPWLDRWIRVERGLHDVVLHDRRGGIRAVVRALRRGEAMCAVLDQNQRKRGLFVPFFGRLASTDRSVAAIACRLAIPIHVGAAVRIGNGFRFRVSDIATLQPQPGGGADREAEVERLVKQVNLVFEELIRAHPDQYLWMHNRYRTRPPHELAARAVASSPGSA